MCVCIIHTYPHIPDTLSREHLMPYSFRCICTYVFKPYSGIHIPRRSQYAQALMASWSLRPFRCWFLQACVTGTRRGRVLQKSVARTSRSEEAFFRAAGFTRCLSGQPCKQTLRTGCCDSLLPATGMRSTLAAANTLSHLCIRCRLRAEI